MDRTLMKRVAKKKKTKKTKRPAPPPPPEPTLEDVVEQEVTNSKVTVNKGEPAPPVVIEEEDSTTAQPAEEETSEETTAAPVTPTEEEVVAEDTVTAQEVLDTVAAAKEEDEEPKKKKSNNRGGRSGDFGAAYNELFVQLTMRMLNRTYRFFQKLYLTTGGNKKKFRKKLEGIQQWNQGEINRRAKEILKIYPDTESYFRYAYAANVMLMSVVVQKDQDSEDVEIEVPKFSEFILKSYTESGAGTVRQRGRPGPVPSRSRQAAYPGGVVRLLLQGDRNCAPHDGPAGSHRAPR